MVQGTSKLAHKQQSARKHTTQPKKGRRAIAPKKPLAKQSAKIKRDLSAKLTNSIEQQMVAAASAGKLTIMKPEAKPTS